MEDDIMNPEGMKLGYALIEEMPEEYECWVDYQNLIEVGVSIIIPGQKIPADFMEIASEYGDMRIEGAGLMQTEVTIIIN